MSTSAEKRARAPKLRFPEFRDAGEWKEKKLGEMTDVRDGTHDSPKFFSKGRPLVTSKNLFEDGTLDLNNVSLICEEDYEQINKRSKVDAGDILFGMIGTIGNPVLVRFDGFAIKNVALFKQKTELLNSYLVQLLRSQHIAKKLSVINSGNSQKFVALGQLRGLSIPTPSIPEQQKIADCLSSLDELITLEAQKLDTLKTHKKGLMQQLFPAEGETLPKLRFPEFRDAGEWQELDLGALTSKIGSGITPTGGDKNYKAEGRPFVRSQNVGWGELILNDVAFVDEETHQSFNSTEIKVSDVLLNITGASIGRSAVADSRIAGGNVNQHVCIIRVKLDEMNPALLNHFLISERGQKQIDSFQAGGNRQGLNFAQIRSFNIPLPPTENEQRKIADCFTSIDNLIIAQTQKLDTLKTHKKGLMQQLFPSLGGVDDEAERGGRPVMDETQE